MPLEVQRRARPAPADRTIRSVLIAGRHFAPPPSLSPIAGFLIGFVPKHLKRGAGVVG